jgi:hypothetical protein
MRRLNVRLAQIDECIRHSMFALNSRPANPELAPGELLLLQLVKQEALREGKMRSRIDFALEFDRLELDLNGTISRAYWPNEGRTWKWIVYGRMTVPTIPFSLEDLGLSRSYDGQDNARLLSREDEARVRPFIQWSLAQMPRPDLQVVPATHVSNEFGRKKVLDAIYNHDRIAIAQNLHLTELALEENEPYVVEGMSTEPLSRFLVEEMRYRRNPALADTLKSYYRHRCQVCGNDFEPRYGEALSESHHIQYLSQGGLDISGNVAVLCPNHHRIIHATNAQFNRHELAYDYPNGLRERLLLPDHFEQLPHRYGFAS